MKLPKSLKIKSLVMTNLYFQISQVITKIAKTERLESHPGGVESGGR